ncbi:MAG: AAA family ATPase [Candidatus Saccharibacteria bacterium]|nr:AAA family ATPase [Candidatus Saccharibacteria bacterium]MCY4089095.1 AAA family ATPase [Candidatus Saccharibacteria bacterium]
MSNQLKYPTLFIIIGWPSSGKTYLSRQLAKDFQINKVHAEQIRATIFHSRYSTNAEENLMAQKIGFLLIEELMRLKLSVICDIDVQASNQRFKLQKLAQAYDFKTVVIYQQVDKQTAWLRCQNRNIHHPDDRYALKLSQKSFNTLCSHFQPPKPQESVIVVSGNHDYKTQKQTILRRLIELQYLVNPKEIIRDIPKPGLVNLIVPVVDKNNPQNNLNITIE